MRLDINHFAKIKRASVKLDGITVIAGENNTGKSTVGKILFCLFRSLYKIDEEIENQRLGSIEESLIDGMNNIYTESGDVIIRRRLPTRHLSPKLHEAAKRIRDASLDERQGHVQNFFKSIGLENTDIVVPVVKRVVARVADALQISDDSIERAIVKSHFESVFNRQICDIYAKDCDANAELTVTGKSVRLSFSQNGALSLEREVSISHNVTSIGSPQVMNFLEARMFWNETFNEQEMDLIYKLKNNIKETELCEILVNSKLEQIYSLLDYVTTGKITRDENNELVLVENGEFSIKVENLSMGIKAFAILIMLLEKGVIKEKDILILDEPEINLHPEWQLIYAEIIVLLEKHFNLTILLTTHSPYFLEAIEMFTQKHEIKDKVNYYLASLEEKEAVFEDVTDDLEPVYKLLAKPFADLESIRYSE